MGIILRKDCVKNTPDNLHIYISSHLKICDYMNRPYLYGLEEVSTYLNGLLSRAKVRTLGANLMYYVDGKPVMEYCPSLGYLGIVITTYLHLGNLLTEDTRKDTDVLLSVIMNHHLHIESKITIPLYDDHFRDVIYRE